MNEHTSLSQLWRQIKQTTGNTKPRAPPHPAPQEEAERLVTLFQDRAATNQLPASTRRRQEDRHLERLELVERVCQVASEHDADFCFEELLAVEKQGKTTTPGEDMITYTMIKNSGEGTKRLILNLINASWQQGQLPEAWRRVNVRPIPKPKDPINPRPIHLLSCLDKTAEKLVRRRLEYKVGPLHPQLFAYRKWVGTAENLAGLLSTIDDNPSIVVFLDLEKAFELVNPMIILDTLARKGVQGRLLGWIKAYISNREILVTFQGKKSGRQILENGTPQGGDFITSPV